MRIELDVFSGRPNPRWVTTPADDARLTAALSRLEPAAGPYPAPDGLGYRGFVVTDGSGREIRVHGSAVEIRTAAGVTTWRDPEHAVVRTLVDLARGHLPDAVHRLVVTAES